MGVKQSHMPHFLAPSDKTHTHIFRRGDVSKRYGALSPEELVAIEEAFLHLASKHEPHNAINKEDFMTRFPLPGALGLRLFQVLDLDNSGSINLINYITMVRLLCKGNTALGRLKIVFHMFDTANDGAVSRDELRTLLNSAAHGAERILRRHNEKVAKEREERAAKEKERMREAEEKALLDVFPTEADRLGGRGGGDADDDDDDDDDDALAGKGLLDDPRWKGDFTDVVDPGQIIAEIVEKHHKENAARGAGSAADGEDGAGTGSSEDDLAVFKDIEATTEVIVDDAFSRYDVDNSGQLTFDRFEAWVSHTPMLLEFMTVVFGEHGERLFDFSDEADDEPKESDRRVAGAEGGDSKGAE